MKMYTRGFNTNKELVDFTNQKGIKKEDIVSIFVDKDGIFTLIYYAE